MTAACDQPTRVSFKSGTLNSHTLTTTLHPVFVSRRILEEQEMELANGGAEGEKKGGAAYGAENLAGLKVRVCPYRPPFIHGCGR